jgi:thiosulfate/3-mercaptopyruvate sulfurtransferase
MLTTISAKDLHERLGDPNVVAIDCRHSLQDFDLGRRLYDEGHVSGAFFASVEDDLSGRKTGKNGRHPMPDPEVFARFLRELGVGDDTLVVAYDGGGDMFAPRLWFLCRWIGHDNAAVLDGGYAAWLGAGYPVSAAPSEPLREGKLSLKLRPELLVDTAHVRAHLGSDKMHLLDVRAPERFRGEVEPIDPIGGHIPGARNHWFKRYFNDDGTLKSPERLRDEFSHIRVDPKLVVHQCGSGVSAAASFWAMAHAGLEGSRVYGGSWSEWVSDPSRPIAKGNS